jgi:hypothetical protein
MPFIGDGIYDNYEALQQWLDSSHEQVLHLPTGRYKVSQTLKVRRRGVKIMGDNLGRVEDGATIIEFYGEDVLFELGETGPGKYNGVQGFRMQDISLVCKNVSYRLVNPYSVSVQRERHGGSCAVVDHKGGGVVLERVQFEHWMSGFLGEQSDINRFVNCNFFYNSTGIHLTEGSDQFTGDSLYFLGNDSSVEAYGCNGARFTNCQFVKEGTHRVAPIFINYCKSITFSACWFEGHSTTHGVTVPAYAMIGNQVECRGVTFRDCTLALADHGSGQRVCDVFAVVAAAKKVLIDNLNGNPQYLSAMTLAQGIYSQRQIVIIGSFENPVLHRQAEGSSPSDVKLLNYWGSASIGGSQ